MRLSATFSGLQSKLLSTAQNDVGGDVVFGLHEQPDQCVRIHLRPCPVLQDLFC